MNSTRFGGRFAPAMVVAALAGLACAGGVATAGPDATSSAITKKKVKKVSRKVANQEIDKRAPTLSVGNSEKLANLAAAQIGPAASVDSGVDITLTGDFQVVLSTELTTAASSRILATGVVELNTTGGDDDVGRCHLRIGGEDGPTYISDVPDASTDRQTLTSIYGALVGAGTHAIELLCNANNVDVESEKAGIVASAHLAG